ncbi:MAG TPA: hypothetical protein PK867_23770 [Pirellulales bacterium]|nr:hypothetical protein [Pirellulales bacterium]
MHRPTVGLIALALLAGAAACWLFGYGSAAIEGAFWRVGLVMGLLWLALPDLLRVRHKFWLFVFLAVMSMAVVRPKLLPLALLFCVIYAVLRPRSAKSRVDRG